jgi:integrase
MTRERADAIALRAQGVVVDEIERRLCLSRRSALALLRRPATFPERACELCGESFTPTNGRQRRCPEHGYEGVALNKWGRRYRRRAVDDLESALRQVPNGIGRKRLGEIGRGDLQQLVDELTRRGMSGSRVRSVVNALRSLYRWAQDRELVERNPAELVRLPAMDARPRDRVATPREFALLLDVLVLADALPYALAGYGTARHQEIRTLDWAHVDLRI